MATLKSIGQKIAETRHLKGMTQEDLAGAAEVNRAFLSNIENGRVNLSVVMLIKLSKALGISPKEFF